MAEEMKRSAARSVEWMHDFHEYVVSLRVRMQSVRLPSDWSPTFKKMVAILNSVVSSMPKTIDPFKYDSIITIVEEVNAMPDTEAVSGVLFQKLIELEELTK